MIHPFLHRSWRWLLPAVLAMACSHTPAQPAPACPPTAQVPSDAQVRDAMRDARDHGFLWRLSKDGRSSWLFGTLHVAKFAWMFPGPRVGEALTASDTIALELDVLDPDVQQRMARGMAAPAGTPPLSPVLQLRLQRQVQAECLPPQSLAGLTPEMQVASLMTLVGRRDGLDPSYGIDLFLAGWARAAKIAVVSLETPELQLKALQFGSPAEAQEFVASALDDLEAGRAAPTLARVAAVWAASDLDALRAYESWCDCLKTAADRAAMKALLDDRNPALADGIAALHAGGKQVFAAVGSLHMIGPLGLPVLMAQRGYRVERVTGTLKAAP